MATNTYEGMFILDSNRYARDPSGTSGEIPTLIEEMQGEILVSRLWEERRLAYPIKGHRKGTYWITYFRIDGSHLADLERRCQINDLFLRHLFLKVEPRIADALVRHAKGEDPVAPDASEDKGEKRAEKEGKKEAEKADAVAADAPA